MQPDRWREVGEVFEAASNLQGADRAAYLRQVYEKDGSLQPEIESLLAASEQSVWIDEPALARIDLDAPSEERKLKTGDCLGRYALLDELGRGGMGTVYKATDSQLGRVVAVKTMSDPNVGAMERRRFVSEAKAASALNHPNIVTIYEYNCDNGIDYIAMEFVEGVTLQELLAQRAATLPEILDWARQIAAALSKAHAAGIVHRDLKPGNLMITSDNMVKILDFGIARRNVPLREDTSSGDLTGTGIVVGTPAYMSPEQARGERVDYRSDIFSFGIILHELTWGRKPFIGKDNVPLVVCVSKNIEISAIPPRTLRKLRSLTESCLKEKPADRLPEIGIAARELAEILDASLTSRKWLGKSGWRQLISVGTLIFMLVAIVTGFSFYREGSFHLPTWLSAGSPRASSVAFEQTQRAVSMLDRYDKPENLDAAVNLLEQVIKRQPDYAPAYASMAQAYLLKNVNAPDAKSRETATKYAAQAVSLNPLLAVVHTAHAMCAALDRNKRSQAAAEFRQALDLDPDSALAMIGLAKIEELNGDLPQATKLFQGAVAKTPNNWVSWTQLALFQYRTGTFENALASLGRARDLTPDNGIVRRNLAVVYQKLDREENAASELQRALEIHPIAPIYTNLGTIRFYQGRYIESIGLMEQAVRLIPQSYLYQGNLADAYRMVPAYRKKAASVYAEAIRLARQAIVALPEDPGIRGSLAVYLARSGDFQATGKELRILDQLKLKTPGSLFKAAIASELCGRREKALDYLASSIKMGNPLREVNSEPDFQALRADPRYDLLTPVRAGTDQ